MIEDNKYMIEDNKYIKIFNLFDIDNKNEVLKKFIKRMIYSYSYIVSDSELDEILCSLNLEMKESITYIDFCSIMSRIETFYSTESELLQAFTILDSDKKGYIIRNDLIKKLTTIGEKLTLDEATKLVNLVNPGPDDRIDYYELVKLLVTNE